MTEAFRTPTGGLIDRTKPLRFRFDGRLYTGYAGDSLASALLANGVHLVSRSFKYHRPRGIVAAGAEEPNAMVQLGKGARTDPNVKATQVALHDGLEARSVNGWPGLDIDLGTINGLFARFIPVGFYYKTFFASPWLWHKVFEPYIRRQAGWGRAPEAADPDIYDHKYVHCDVLVVGGGPAGLAAARTASAGGARVILADEGQRLGGDLLNRGRSIDGRPALDWVNEGLAELADRPEVTVLPRCTVFGAYDDNFFAALEMRTDHDGRPSSPADPRARLWHIRANQVVLATGAHERPLVFADNDRPGIMLAGAAQAYLHRYGVVPGRQAVLFGNNDSVYETALTALDAGMKVAALVDCRPGGGASATLTKELQKSGVEILAGHGVVATAGAKRITGVTVARLDAQGETIAGGGRNFACDCLLMSGGWSPVVHLHCHRQGKLRFDEDQACFAAIDPVPHQHPAGALRGDFHLEACLDGGAQAGARAARAAGIDPGTPPTHRAEDPGHGPLRGQWLLPGLAPLGHGKAKHFVDFQNDTTAADIHLAVREGFHSVEHMKRYTLSGFGTDQGKTGNINALAILSRALDKPIPETGTTTFRPPYTPVPFGAMGGRAVGPMMDVIRTTSIHDWHVEHGAAFEDVGQWKRPWYYPRPGEDMHAAVNRECLAVRNGVGVLDASTLGKIDIRGPDAAEFLNRLYTNAWSKLAVGRSRYGVMCHEDGMVFDDGTTTRLDEQHYLMTTTTGGAATVLDWLEEYHQTEWPDLRVWFTSVTEQWATVSINGPKSRAVLATLTDDIDLNPAAFPFMSFREGHVAGIPARVFRISFSGELAYEVNVPWNSGLALWKAVMGAGMNADITPYGTETMHVLRAEKGFIIVGQETDGTQSPQDLGLDWLVSKAKPDFIGKRSYSRADNLRPDRKQLVGIRTKDPREVLPEGAQLVVNPQAAMPIPMEGHVTSSYYSAALGHSIALALVKGGAGRHGETLFAPLEHKTVPVTLVSPVFYDPQGERRDG